MNDQQKIVNTSTTGHFPGFKVNAAEVFNFKSLPHEGTSFLTFQSLLIVRR